MKTHFSDIYWLVSVLEESQGKYFCQIPFSCFHSFLTIFKYEKIMGSFWLLTEDQFFLLSLAFSVLLWLVIWNQRVPGVVTFSRRVLEPCSAMPTAALWWAFPLYTMPFNEYCQGLHLLYFSLIFLVSTYGQSWWRQIAQRYWGHWNALLCGYWHWQRQNNLKQ